MPAPTAPGTARRQPCPHPPRPARARPSSAFLDLGPVLTAPGCARAWTRQILWEWGLTALADAAESVVSELVANSVNASRGLDRRAVRLTVTREWCELAIRVRDHHPGAPQARTPGAEDENGRGLLLVEALSDRCGWHPLREGGPGKVTWAVLKAPPAAPGDLAARFMTLAAAWPGRARQLSSGYARPCMPPAPAASERSTRDARQPY